MNIDERIEALHVNIESLHSSVSELYATVMQHTKQIEEHTKQLEQDAEHIRALVRIAEIHEQRLSRLEGEDNGASHS